MKRQRREPVVLSQMRPMNLFLVLAGCIILTFCLIHISNVVGFIKKIFSALGPVFAGLVFAYLLNPVAVWFERRLTKLFGRCIKKHPKLKGLPRGISAFLAVLLFVGALSLLVVAVFSQVVEGVSTALDQLPHYLEVVVERAQALLHSDNNLTKYLQQLYDSFSATELGMGQVDTVDVSQRIISVIASGAAGTFGFVYNVVVGFIIAVYMLISKERFILQLKQLLFAVVKPKTARWIDMQMTKANKTFSTAVLGKIVDSLIIGILCFIGVTIMHTPYTTLIAVIIGITNMIPYFGPIFGAIPCVLLILMENPMKALYFLIFIVALQQFDANILDPRIVGQSIGLPAFWELFACMLGAGLFGIIGLVIGVPVFAVVYELVRQLVSERLAERVKDGELESEFVKGTLGVTDSVTESGLLDDDDEEDDVDSQYVEHLILLEDISEQPERKK